MTYILIFVLFYLLVTSIVFISNRYALTPLPDPVAIDEESLPRISVCIPARNEERSIARCINSILDQDYPNLQILVLNDRSTDSTAAILKKLQDKRSEHFTVLQGEAKPEHWLGKPWACHQLSQAAEGDMIVFADADTWFAPDSISRVAGAFRERSLDFLTVWPQQRLESFWEKMIIPLVYYALLSILPARFVYQIPRIFPGALRRQLSSYFAAACGQFLVFTREAYEKIGGHRSVRQQVVEDVALAKKIRRSGMRMRMYEGVATVNCRMYTSEDEIESGFRKNLFAGFGFRLTLFILAGLLHLCVYVLPFVLLPIAIWDGLPVLAFLAGLAIFIILAHRLALAIWFNWNPLYGFLHPLSVLWFQKLAVKTIYDRWTGRKVTWKQRPVN